MSDELFAAIESHSVEQVAALLDAGVSPDATKSTYPKWTALCAVIEELESGGPIDMLILLLRHGATVDGLDASRDTAMLMAVFRNQPEAMRILLAAGADPNVVGDEGDSALRWCAEHGRYSDAVTLLRCGAAQTIDGAGGITAMTALGHAASRLDLPMILLLLDAGADPTANDNDRETARKHLPPRTPANEKVWNIAAALFDDGRTTM